MNESRIAFIGGGNMARSLIGGLTERDTPPGSIAVAEPDAGSREALARDCGVAVDADNAAVAAGADVLVLAVKPQLMREVCAGLASVVRDASPLVVSIAAGITSGQIDRWLGGGHAIVRCMPNTPALLGCGAAGLYANARVSAAQRALAQRLLDAVGISAWIDDEALMDAVTAVSGSGPAYVFLLAEAMESAAIAQGLPADVAGMLVRHTLLGAARMLVETGEPPEMLRQRVTSPGGTTQAAIESFESGGFRELVAAAIAAAHRRGGELSAAND